LSRIDETFARLRSAGRTGLVTYVTAGDPDTDRSALILQTLDQSGADILEVGIPFSDPLADGPVIQRASERALAVGTTLKSSLRLIGAVRPMISSPIVVFTYANPILAMGLERFMRRAADVGVDGILVLDLPIEEAGELHDAATAVKIDPIFLLSPTTTERRIRHAAELGRGFLYGISRLGVTGQRDTIAEGASLMVERIRRVTKLPVALGFGISRPEHVVAVGRFADAAVVGSGLVSRIAEASNSGDLTGEVRQYVRWLRSGLDDPLASGREWGVRNDERR
jgi:tryptophan synthase alpha chain